MSDKLVFEYSPLKFFVLHRLISSFFWLFCLLALLSSVGELAFWVHQWLPFSVLDERVSLLGAQKLNVWGDVFLICSILYFIPKFLTFLIRFPMDLFSKELVYEGEIERIDLGHHKTQLLSPKGLSLTMNTRDIQELDCDHQYKIFYTATFKIVKRIEEIS